MEHIVCYMQMDPSQHISTSIGRIKPMIKGAKAYVGPGVAHRCEHAPWIDVENPWVKPGKMIYKGW